MPTYIELYDNLYSNVDLEKRVVIAVLHSARTVIIEDPATPLHSDRLRWTVAALTNPTLVGRKMIPAVITDSNFQDGIFTDAELQTLISSVINIFASLV